VLVKRASTSLGANQSVSHTGSPFLARQAGNGLRVWALSYSTTKSRWSPVTTLNITLCFDPVICLVRWITGSIANVGRDVVEKLHYHAQDSLVTDNIINLSRFMVGLRVQHTALLYTIRVRPHISHSVICSSKAAVSVKISYSPRRDLCIWHSRPGTTRGGGRSSSPVTPA